MNWVLFVVLATSTGSDKAINATPVPMATEQLCNEAKNKLFESYRRTNTPNFVIVIECLKAQTAESDKRLNKAFETAIKASTPKQVEKLREAERLWISFRDADCLFFGLGEGTVAGVAAAQCLLNLTEARARELEEIGPQ